MSRVERENCTYSSSVVYIGSTVYVIHNTKFLYTYYYYNTNTTTTMSTAATVVTLVTNV